ncbi:MAG: nickel-binding protein [Methyloceanibacter sp.]|jgi:hypothetical protein
MADRVRWIRSYVVKEPGTFCIYQAQDPESIREHARRVGMPGDQIFPVVNTVVIRDDPAEQAPLPEIVPAEPATMARQKRDELLVVLLLVTARLDRAIQ